MAVRWTVNTLTAQIRGELAQDANAAGGTVPDRLQDLVIEAGKHLWNDFDWRWNDREGTLTIVASSRDADAPADFHKLNQRWLAEYEADTSLTPSLRFTDNSARWQGQRDLYSASEGRPVIAMVQQDTTETTVFTWKFSLAPIPDAVYTYTYRYLSSDPWSLVFPETPLANTAAPMWPAWMDEGWRWLALVSALQAFQSGDRWQSVLGRYNSWIQHRKEENNETISFESDSIITDGYGDLAGRFGDGFYGGSQWQR